MPSFYRESARAPLSAVRPGIGTLTRIGVINMYTSNDSSHLHPFQLILHFRTRCSNQQLCTWKRHANYIFVKSLFIRAPKKLDVDRKDRPGCFGILFREVGLEFSVGLP